MKKFFIKIRDAIEKVLPMTLGSFIIFAFTIYLFYIVGRSVLVNHDSNLDISKQESVVAELEEKIVNIRNEINYYQTYSYKEKEARSKLGYKAPGETVVVLPLDQMEIETVDQQPGEVHIKTPNYRLWWEYFFNS